METLPNATIEALKLLFTGDPELWSIVSISFSVSLRALLLSTPFAILAAFLLSFFHFPGRRLLILTSQTLMSVPAVVIGLTVYLLLSRQGPFGDLKLLFSQSAMIIGQILLCFPIIVSMGHAAFAAAGKLPWETARTLGAGRLHAWVTLLYQVRFGLLVAVLSGFGRIISEVGVSLMVGGNILSYTRNIPTAIALETSKGEFAQGIALGIVLLLLSLLLNGFLILFQGQKGSIT